MNSEFLNKVDMSSTVPFVRAEVEAAGLFDELGGGEVAVRTERRRVRQSSAKLDLVVGVQVVSPFSY